MTCVRSYSRSFIGGKIIAVQPHGAQILQRIFGNPNECVRYWQTSEANLGCLFVFVLFVYLLNIFLCQYFCLFVCCIFVVVRYWQTTEDKPR